MLASARLAASIANVTVYEKILAAAPTATSLHHVPTVQGIFFIFKIIKLHYHFFSAV